MTEYVLFYEGEEALRRDSMAEMVKELREIRKEYIEDVRQDMKMYPDCYDDNFDTVASADEWMAEIYELMQVVPLPELDYDEA